MIVSKTDFSKWWDSMTLEEQFYKTIECNHLIKGDCTRHPDTLSIREVKLIYEYFNNEDNK